MILSNIEIQTALDSGRLIITPEPQPRRPSVGDPTDKCPYDAHALDLTLGSEITVPETGTYAYDLMQEAPEQREKSILVIRQRSTVSISLGPSCSDL